MNKEHSWPDDLTPELADILGRPNFMCGSLARLYRDAGFEIATKAEAEQAFVIHRFIGFWMERGADWKDAAQADIEKHVAIVKSKEAA